MSNLQHAAEMMLVLAGELAVKDASGEVLALLASLEGDTAGIKGCVEAEQSRRLLSAGLKTGELIKLLEGNGHMRDRDGALKTLTARCLSENIGDVLVMLARAKQDQVQIAIARGLIQHTDVTKDILLTTYRTAKRDCLIAELASGLANREDFSDEELVAELKTLKRADAGFLHFANRLEGRLTRHKTPISHLADWYRELREDYVRMRLLSVIRSRVNEIRTAAGLEPKMNTEDAAPGK